MTKNEIELSEEAWEQASLHDLTLKRFIAVSECYRDDIDSIKHVFQLAFLIGYQSKDDSYDKIKIHEPQ
jgi:hypothetical protein